MKLRNAARLLAVTEVLSPHVNGVRAHRLADVVELVGESGIEVGEFEVPECEDSDWLRVALGGLDDARVSYWYEELARLQSEQVNLVSVTDSEYPANLRMIHDRPPFLFVRGDLIRDDRRAVAVVGTRNASAEGLKLASRLAAELVRQGVTVVSGLAKGIDTAAHAGALSEGGRTIAVFGTSINKIYPAQNRALAGAIVKSGACVSQFLPSQSGGRWMFPARNVVTSGLSVGTVVVEAGPTSGARIQSEQALAHGKRLFLMTHLVESQEWACEMSQRAEVDAVSSVDEVIAAISVDLDENRSVLL